jgi:hypothetical protein
MATRRKGPTLASYSKRLRELPRITAIKVAQRGAGQITTAAQGSLDSGLTAHDEARPLGTSGNAVTLRQTGALRAALQFLSDGGTRIRVAVQKRYMGVMVGRFEVLPHAGRLPARWRRLLDREAMATLKEEARP